VKRGAPGGGAKESFRADLDPERALLSSTRLRIHPVWMCQVMQTIVVLLSEKCASISERHTGIYLSNLDVHNTSSLVFQKKNTSSFF
jgi:hypothetical protein